MNDKQISSVVIISVLLVAIVGVFLVLKAPAIPSIQSEGKSIEGARLFYEAHKPFQYGDVEEFVAKIEASPVEELPASEYLEGFCVLMFNKRSGSLVPVPVPRGSARNLRDSDTVSQLEESGWLTVKVMPSDRGRLCPAPNKMPTIADIAQELK